MHKILPQKTNKVNKTVNNKTGDTMKTILYTGGSGGIAKEVIKKIKHKYFIYVGVHTEKQLELITNRYKDEKNIKVIKLDLLSNNDLEKIKQLDTDILISNAAIGYGGSIAEIDIIRLKEIFEVNVFQNFKLVQIVLKNMIKKGKGKIIMISSLSGLMPLKFMGPYSSSKASIIRLTQSLKSELKLINKNIKISLIEPGMYKTGFNQLMIEDKYEWMKNKSYFKKELEMIRKKENIFWRLFEYKSLNSIVKQITKAIKHDDKFIYSAPTTQRILAKIYEIIND